MGRLPDFETVPGRRRFDHRASGVSTSGGRRLKYDMSAETVQLLVVFEMLPATEQPVFVREILRRLPPCDSGPLDDQEAAQAGDEWAALLEREENDSQAR